MWGLMKKDIFTIKRQVKMILAIGVLYLVLAITTANSSLIISLMLVVAMMMPITCMAYDERCKWDMFANALPISLHVQIAEKYIFPVILMTVAEAVLLPITYIINRYKAPEESFAETVIGSTAIGIAGIFFLSVMFPLLFKFGVERGRLALFVVAAIIGLGGTAVANLGNKTREMPTELSNIIAYINNNPVFILGIFFLAVICIYVISFFISLGIEKKKEY